MLALLTVAGLLAQAAVNPYAEEDAVLSKALALRVRVLEQSTGFKFNAGYLPVGRWEDLSTGQGRWAAGRYEVETGNLQFAPALISELNAKYKVPVRLMDPATVAADDSFTRIADHELGHALADQISRRHGLGVYYTPESWEALPPGGKIGLKAVSEGIGMFFQCHGLAQFKSSGGGWFPAKGDDERFYQLDLLVYSGGEWLVHDILAQHGERGLVWLIAHPLTLGDDKRADALVYRQQALKELAK